MIAKYAHLTIITPEQASEVAVELQLDRPYSAECVAKVRRAFQILDRHRSEKPVTVSGLGTVNERFFVPSQGIWDNKKSGKRRVYEVRLSAYPADWSTCDCPEWRKQARIYRSLPFVPYECKHGIAVRLVLMYDVVFDHVADSDTLTHFDSLKRVEGVAEPMRFSAPLQNALKNALFPI